MRILKAFILIWVMSILIFNFLPNEKIVEVCPKAKSSCGSSNRPSPSCICGMVPKVTVGYPMNFEQGVTAESVTINSLTALIPAIIIISGFLIFKKIKASR